MSALFDRTVCLSVTFHRPGNQRKFRPGEVTVDKADAAGNGDRADQSQVSASKQIFTNGNYKLAGQVKQQFESWLDVRSLPCPLKKGTHLIPVDLLDEVYTRLDETEREYLARAEDLANEYETAKQTARERLRELYNEADYPTVDQLRKKFSVERKLFDFAPPGETKLSETLYQQERERWSATFAEAETEVRDALRDTARQLVAHLSERLAPTPDGSRKRLHPSAVDNLEEFLSLFDRRNVLDDSELKALVGKARAVLSGVGNGQLFAGANKTGILKDDDRLADYVSQEMDGIRRDIDALMSDAPRRALSFDEED